MEIVLKVLSLVRNLCAHNERLYNFKPKDIIKENRIHHKLDLERGPKGCIHCRKDLYAVLICIGLFIDNDEMKNMVREINEQLEILKEQLKVVHVEVITEIIGFLKMEKNSRGMMIYI